MIYQYTENTDSLTDEQKRKSEKRMKDAILLHTSQVHQLKRRSGTRFCTTNKKEEQKFANANPTA